MSDQAPENQFHHDLRGDAFISTGDGRAESRQSRPSWLGAAGDGAPPPPAAGASAATYPSHPDLSPGDYSDRLMHHVRVLYKRRWTVAAALVLVFGTASLYAFLATPIYESRVQILIEDENQKVVNFANTVDENRAADYYQTQYRILQSRLLARRTLDAEHLWAVPQFAGQPAGGITSILSSPADVVTRLFTASTPSEVPDATETAQQSKAIDAFLRSLTVSPVRNSRLVDVTFASPDRALTARVANAVAREYIAQDLDFKFRATRQANDFLNQQMAQQRKQVEQSEQAIQQYREQNDSVSLEDKQNIVVQRLAELNAAVTKARTERIQKEATWNQIRAIQSDRAALDTHPFIVSNAFIQQLKAELAGLQRQQAQLADKLGDRHPDMIKLRSAIDATQAKLQAELAKVVQSIRNDYETALAQERSLNAALDQQKNEAMALNRQAIDYGVLQRDAAANRQIFDGLLQRTRETGIEGELRASNIRVVDQAEVPVRPARPNRAAALFLGLLGGGLFGIALAFSFEYLDSRIKSPEEITTQLRLPFLGLVPALSADVASGALISSDAPHQFAEAIRTIRTNVLFASAEPGCKSLVVTSTAPGEGKTLLSANLATSLALAGQRVLLIDADMRRPKLHETFGLSQEPGLSNVLVGDAKLGEAVKRSSVTGLWVLCAGKNPPNPAELIGSRRCKDLLKAIGDHFDWVILDTPPVMAVTDAAMIANHATGVVFVVGAEAVSRFAAKRALDQLEHARARFAGAVLNRADVKRHSYYYAHYYRSEYTSYYAESGAASR